MSEWDKLWEGAEIENGKIFSAEAELTQIKEVGDSLKEKADKWDKTIEVIHNYEVKAFLDRFDEHRAMRKAFETLYNMVEEYLTQDETRKRSEL